MTGKAASCPDSVDMVRCADVEHDPRRIPASLHGAHYLPQGTKQPCYGEHFLLRLPRQSQVQAWGTNMTSHCNPAGEQSMEESFALGRGLQNTEGRKHCYGTKPVCSADTVQQGAQSLNVARSA